MWRMIEPISCSIFPIVEGRKTAPTSANLRIACRRHTETGRFSVNSVPDLVAYYRVSTARQGQSGLGLDAQRSAVSGFLHGRGELAAEFTEVESGRKNDRPQIAAALDLCCRRRAVLVIAKLDSLARNVAFVARLMESGVEFIAVDNPHANKLMVHMLAAFAEHERDQISAARSQPWRQQRRGGYSSAIPGCWRSRPGTGRRWRRHPPRRAPWRCRARRRYVRAGRRYGPLQLPSRHKAFRRSVAAPGGHLPCSFCYETARMLHWCCSRWISNMDRCNHNLVGNVACQSAVGSYSFSITLS